VQSCQPGLLFVLFQYFIYSALVDAFGINGTIRVTACAVGPLIALIPVSLLLLNNHPHDRQGYEYDNSNLSVKAFLFLTGLLALYRVLSVAFFSSIIVATNRSVAPAHRGTMNGLSTLSGSVAKTLGPSFAGILASFSLSSGVFQPQVGSVFMWLVLGIFGMLLAWTTSRLLGKASSR
jgi:MFS family permease